MKFNFYYEEKIPRYEDYRQLLMKMNKLSKEFYSLDKILRLDYNHSLMQKYKKEKKKIVDQMLKEILSCFNNLYDIPCSIYLNGSYARGNVTAGSDIDLTFFFNKKDVPKYQSLVYLIRLAIATMFNVNIVHVHSFTKNFVTEYRIKNKLVVHDQELETRVTWTKTNQYHDIFYPKNQMIAEREICEISSIKDIESLSMVYENQIKKLHPKEWIYTHECILITDTDYSIEKLVEKLDQNYSKKNMNIVLNNIKDEIKELLTITLKYHEKLDKCSKVEMAEYNMIGKRKVCMLVHAFATYLRWYLLFHDSNDIPLYLDLDYLFNYNNNLIDNSTINRIGDINKDYDYFRFLISRIEVWSRNYNHNYEHRSKEIIYKKDLNNEYSELWKNKYSPIDEQIKTYKKIANNIEYVLEKIG